MQVAGRSDMHFGALIATLACSDVLVDLSLVEVGTKAADP